MSDKGKVAASPKQIPTPMKFVIGGLSGMAGLLFVQPMDVVKTRMQVSGVGRAEKEFKTSWAAARAILSREGALALYSGLGAGLLRQASYSTVRLGVYTYLFQKLSSPDGKPPGLLTKMWMGATAGAAGAVVGNPADLALVRMMADGRLPAGERRNYKNAIDALYRIAREEGLLGLWTGVVPTAFRAVVVNTAQLATYSQFKEIYASTGYFKEGVLLYFLASMTSGFVTTVVSLPVDIAKTRVQNMKIIDGKPEFSGALDVFVKVIRTEGFFALWKGFTPYLSKLGPHTVLILMFLEQFTNMYKKYFM